MLNEDTMWLNVSCPVLCALSQQNCCSERGHKQCFPVAAILTSLVTQETLWWTLILCPEHIPLKLLYLGHKEGQILTHLVCCMCPRSARALETFSCVQNTTFFREFQALQPDHVRHYL